MNGPENIPPMNVQTDLLNRGRQPFKNSEKGFGISATYIPYKFKIIDFQIFSNDFRMPFILWNRLSVLECA